MHADAFAKTMSRFAENVVLLHPFGFICNNPENNLEISGSFRKLGLVSSKVKTSGLTTSRPHRRRNDYSATKADREKEPQPTAMYSFWIHL